MTERKEPGVAPVGKRLGIVSDTHGMVRERMLAVLRGVDLIVHAGDIGSPEVLAVLRRVAPVVAVRGNTDGVWAAALPLEETVTVGGRSLLLLHDLDQISLQPGPAGYGVVVSGHTHEPRRSFRDGVLYLNPGSAGPRRNGSPPTLALLTLSGLELDPEFVLLE